MTSGPTTSQPTIAAARAEAIAGTYTEAQIVWIVDLAAFVVVVPPGASGLEPKIYRTRYDDLIDSAADLALLTASVPLPTMLATVDPYVSIPHTQNECGTLKSSAIALPNVGGFRVVKPLKTNIVLLRAVTSAVRQAANVIPNYVTNAAICVGSGGSGRVNDITLTAISMAEATVGQNLWTYTLTAADIDPAGTSNIPGSNGEAQDLLAVTTDGNIYTTATIDPLVGVSYSIGICLDSAGIEVWRIANDSAASNLYCCASSESNMAFFDKSGGTWAGGAVNDRAVVVNATTGAAISYGSGASTGWTTNGVACAFIGAAHDKLLTIQQTSVAGATITCNDPTLPLGSGVLWSLDRTTDFPSVIGFTTTKPIRLPDGGFCFGEPVSGKLFFVSEAGVVSHETQLEGGYVRQIQLSTTGDIIAALSPYASASARLARLPAPYTAEAWPAEEGQLSGSYSSSAIGFAEINNIVLLGLGSVAGTNPAYGQAVKLTL
jgi:hypothetical protein